MRNSKTPYAIAIATTAVLVIAGVYLSMSGESEVGAPPEAAALPDLPAAWPVDGNARAGFVDIERSAFNVGAVTIEVPQPIGATMRWRHELSGFVGSGQVAGGQVDARWAAAQGSPHTRFSATITAPRASLSDSVVSQITLPPGELTVVNAALARSKFGDEAVELDALTRGAIEWRNGEDVVELSQWRADRVRISAVDGGYHIDFVWWDPTLHVIDPTCADELAAQQLTVNAEVSITFGMAGTPASGRLPGGATSAVVPLFVDLQDHAPPLQDGASSNARDFAARARTVAFGHSSPADARYGNGGLVGLDVGGTIVLPSTYPPDDFDPLREALAATSVEVTSAADLVAENCVRYAADEPLLGEPVEFDGKFPNIFGTPSHVPSTATGATVWRATRLTGRRKEVVTQTLSTTYLTRLAAARGIALLEIPLVATRNPLVAAAAEALLEPERDGHWTIHEELARALAEVELLAESESFDFVSLRELDSYNRAAREVVLDPIAPGQWRVHNAGEAVRGFTLIADGALQPTVGGVRVQTQLRKLSDGGSQTWFWWDLQANASVDLDTGVADLRGVTWTVRPQ